MVSLSVNEHTPATKLVEDCPPSTTLHVYTRVSTAGQQEMGTSLQTQYEEGVRRAEQLGFQWRHWNEGGRSSNHEDIAQRPVLYSLYNAIRSAQVKHLYVYDQSRLSRNDIVASVFRHECRKHGVTIHTKDGRYDLSNPSDQLLTQMLNAVAEFDNSVRVDKTRRGRIKRAKDGYWMGGAPPYGYAVVARRLSIDHAEAVWVRLMFESRAAGVSVGDIKRALDSNNVRPRMRKRWSGASIRSVIKNTHHSGFYTVVDRANGGEFRINCDQIVSAEIWQQANEAIDAEWVRRRSTPKSKKTTTLLRPLLFCGHCGRRFVVHNTQATKSTVYYCPMKQREWARVGESVEKGTRFTGCGMDRSIRVEALEEAVFDISARVLDNDAVYSARFEQSVMSGRPLIVSRAHERSLHRKLKELVGTKNALVFIADQSERRSVPVAAAVADNIKPAYRHRLRIKEISEEIDQINLRLEEKENYEKFKNWIQDLRGRFKRIKGVPLEEGRAIAFEIIDGIEVTFKKEENAHVIKVIYRHPLIGSEVVRVSCLPLSGGKRGMVITQGGE